MADGLTIKNFTKFEKDLLNLANKKFPNEKRKILNKVGAIVEREIKKQVPVDTGRLRASITHEVIDKNTAQVGTNVEYAKAVNNGHMVDKRFLPAKYLNTPSGRKYLKKGNTKGIMLHPQFVKGSHFMEKGLQNSETQVYNAIENWLGELFDKIGD